MYVCAYVLIFVCKCVSVLVRAGMHVWVVTYVSVLTRCLVRGMWFKAFSPKVSWQSRVSTRTCASTSE